MSSLFEICGRVEQTYQDAAIWQGGHVIDHNLSEWRTTGWNVSEPIYCHLGGETGTYVWTVGIWLILLDALLFASPYLRAPWVKPFSWTPTKDNSWRKVFFYVVVQVCTWWVGGPELGVVRWTFQSAPQLPLTFLLLQLCAHSPQVLTVTRVQSVTRGDTCKQTGLTRFIQGGLNTHLSKRQRAVSCLHLEPSGLTLHQEEHRDWPECTRRGWGGWVFGSPFLWSGT